MTYTAPANPPITDTIKPLTSAIEYYSFAIMAGLGGVWFFTAFGAGYVAFVWRSMIIGGFAGAVYVMIYLFPFVVVITRWCRSRGSGGLFCAGDIKLLDLIYKTFHALITARGDPGFQLFPAHLDSCWMSGRLLLA